MDGIDPDVLLEWLQTGFGDERDLQLMALEQLCMLLLMSDNIDRCFESCPPRTFLPALCKIFLDESAPDNVLEVTARAITYYLDVSNECTRRITQVDGAVKAICKKLSVVEKNNRTSQDLAEQCVKLLEHVCQRETLAVYDAGGMNAMLALVRQQGCNVHKDTMHSAMSVVTRLCGKMEPSDADLPKCAESLGALLAHEDTKVAECALRCFAALTDRFIRKMMDPAELATHSNLVEHLLKTLAAEPSHSANLLSIVLSLLSNLCRGSAAVTEQVLKSSTLLTAIRAILTSKDERCVTDGLRLADLLVILLCDGRSSLPHIVAVSGDTAQSSQNVEKANRHLIDSIRQKDLNALVEAIETGTVDVNFTDDVGQTLCNWSSAFGSLEMVQYLCDKGADVNKGHKSSSLHYAACFGRPEIVKLLLQRGANPDLRDEDGKTALDKARERSDEDHSQVSQILESPSVYMHSNADEQNKTKSMMTSQTNELPDREMCEKVLRQLLPIFCDIFQKSLSMSVRRNSLSLLRKIVEHMEVSNLKYSSSNDGIPDIAEGLIAVVVSVLDQEDDYDGQEQVLLILSSVLKKDPQVWIAELIRFGVFERVGALAKEPLKAEYINVNSSTSQEDDVSERSHEDPQSSSSQLSADINKTAQIEEVTSSEVQDSGVASIVSAITSAVSSSLLNPKEDKKSKQLMMHGTPYRWKEWRICRGSNSAFIWSEVLAVEFCLKNNGSVKYLINDEFVAMSATGALEDTSDPAVLLEKKSSFVQRWQKAKQDWSDDALPMNVLSVPSAHKKIEISTWEMISPKSNELVFKSLKGSSVLTIKDDVGGFVFETSEKKKIVKNSESALPSIFYTGWSIHGLSGKKAKIRNELQRLKVNDLAWNLWEGHLKNGRAKPREALVELQKACDTLKDAVANAHLLDNVTVKSKQLKQPRIEKVQQLVAAMKVVRDSVLDERRLSTFEFSVSGLVPAMHAMLTLIDRSSTSYPARIFQEAFSEGLALKCLVQKMVMVLEANEKFPQYLYDTPGGSAFGLQLLSRRIRMKLELAAGSKTENDHLLNRSGKILKSEPVTSVGNLKTFLLKMVAKQWYDRERKTFNFVRLVNEKKAAQQSLKFEYTSDFDEEGIIFWLGTNGKNMSEWTNPAMVNVVQTKCSDNPQPFGKASDILSRDANAVNCHTSDDKNAFFLIDLGLFVYPSAYTLRHARGYGRSALRNWILQGSKDKENWEMLVHHSDDTSLADPGSTATWPIEQDEKKGPFRYIRIAQNGKNSSNQTHYLSLSGFEIYGEVTDVVVDNFAPMEPEKVSDECERGTSKDTPSTEKPITTCTVASMPQGSNNNKLKIGISAETLTAMQNRFRMRMARKNTTGNERDLRGSRVVRGPDWRWGTQDSAGEGQIVSLVELGWVDVAWDNGHINSYRFGADGRFDIKRLDDAGTSQDLNSSLLTAMRLRGKEASKSREARESSSPLAGLSSFSSFVGRGGKKNVASTPLSRYLQTTSSSSSTTPSTSSVIGKKSMSTTNLMDDKDRGSAGPSVASTGQAASAESLQHQTPSLENLLARANTHAFGKISEVMETGDGIESTEEVATMKDGSSVESCSSQSSVNEHDDSTDATLPSTPQTNDSKLSSLSVSAPNLAAVKQKQSANDTFDMNKTLEESSENDEQEDDDDRSSKEFSELMADAFGGSDSERNLLEKLRAVLHDDSIDSSSSDTFGRTGFSFLLNPKAKKEKPTIKQKLGGYADVLKGIMQTMIESSSSQLDVEELLEDDDYYDEEDGNEDDMDDELGGLEVPVESLVTVLSNANRSETCKLNWKQLSQLMGSGIEHRLRENKNHSAKSFRSWEDELVLKCTFPALIPAFDPRPGRTNVNQTQEVELPSVVPDVCHSKMDTMEDTTLRLFLRGPNQPGVENITIELADDSESIFRYVQDLINMSQWNTKGERNRRVWEPTYTLLYEDSSRESSVAANPIPCGISSIPKVVSECLDVISLLSRVVDKLPEASVSPQVFISDKITQKLTQELSDALVVASRALPRWCELLVYTYPCLFSMETRNMYLNATAYGVSRAIVWLQSRRDMSVDRSRSAGQPNSSSAARADRYQEFRIGRLKHERIKVSRSEELLLEQAIRLMKFHADRKAVLELEYTGEEGTGLGPTLEFYALVAAELQRKALALWLCDDSDELHLKAEERELDLGEGKKPPGYYVRRKGGLFPAPLPPQSEEVRRASEIFRMLGIFLAKVLQDGRLVDLPLSRPFLKLMTSSKLNSAEHPSLEQVLTLDDFEEVHPVKGGFLKELKALEQRKRAIENDPGLDREAKRRKIDELKLCIRGTRCKVEDLALNFTVNPPSNVFEYDEMELIENGADTDVTMDNVDEYVEKCADFYLNSGIIEQLRAFREGFDKVFPLKCLKSYSPEEVQRLISGEQCPEWTREDVLNFTEPKLGYNKDSPGFQRFVDVMVGLNAQERKNFLQFATGCSSLPPGGLANLHPRLTVVRKVESGDGSYPSVNTCVHYLKLPEYSSADILRDRLLTAVNEKGFHLN